jgi:hypothetical protein
MGDLSDSLVTWVRAVNRRRKGGTKAAQANMDRAITRAFNSMLAALMRPQNKWDKADLLAWEILQAFDV